MKFPRASPEDWIATADSDDEQAIDDPAAMKSGHDAPDLGPFGEATLRVRKEQYLEKPAVKAALSKSAKVLLVNLHQNSHFFSDNQYAPSLLQRSQLYNLVTMKEVLPIEHFLIQGFPVPGLAEDRLSKFFPFKSLVQAKWHNDPSKLNDQEMRSITGIGFSWPAFGAILSFVMCSTRVLEDDPDWDFKESTSRQDDVYPLQPPSRTALSLSS